jgi:ribonuclease P protein component
MRYQKNNKSDYRLAVVVSKKVAPRAVTRNRIRRRLFEQVRTQGRVSNLPVDLIIYVKTIDVVAMDSLDLNKEIADLTKKMLAQLK